jgi:hypothetical protein
MNMRELISEVERYGVAAPPPGTIRRWAYEGLISRPTSYGKKGQQGGRFSSWPPETVEQILVISILRNSNLPWGTSVKGWPRTKKGKAKTTVSNEMLFKVKSMVAQFYASISVNDPPPPDQNGMFELLEPVKFPAGGYMYGGFATHPVFIAWVTTLEKIRHNKPLHKPIRVVFNWRHHLIGEKETKLKYDGITVEPCKCEVVSCSVGEFTREAHIAVYGKEPIDWAKAKREGATIPLERFVEVRQDVEGQQVIMQDTFTKTTIALKKADRAEWGPPPWENDD